jgi:hypothetical protein
MRESNSDTERVCVVYGTVVPYHRSNIAYLLGYVECYVQRYEYILKLRVLTF